MFSIETNSAISAEYTKEMDGAISVSSELNVGTTFIVYLPKVSAQSEHIALPKFKPTCLARRILVVDDEELLTGLMKTMLEKLGHTAYICNDPIQALKNHKENPDKYDLIITDYSMPKMNGAQLAAKLFESNPTLPIFLVTGYRKTVTESSASDERFDAYLAKPFTSSMLAKAIGVAIESKANSTEDKSS